MTVIVTTSVCIFVLKNKENVVYGAEEASARFNPETLQDNEHMHVEIDESGEKVPVPNGYVGSNATGESEIDTGYVIYEGTEEVNDSNVEEAQKTRNQYVWIPVPDASKMYGTDENGKKWGKTYLFTIDEGEEINKITGTYATNWVDLNGVMSFVNKNDYREPDKIKHTQYNFDMDYVMKSNHLEEKSTLEFLNILEREFSSMIESVENYGGFYIGRYETGNMRTEIPVIRKFNNDTTDRNWYECYRKLKNISINNTSVKTGLIFGNQWDRTLIWLIESGSKTKEEICKDSTSWGNFKNANFTYKSSSNNIYEKEAGDTKKLSAGSSEYTKANNIYDLAGNQDEWTMEAYRDRREFRGGNYYQEKNYVSHRNGYFPDTSHGCRAMLYIK